MNKDVPAENASPGEPPRGDISPRVTSETRVQHNLRVPMRDGVELSLDLVRPDIEGRLPVVLVRTPYDKVGERSGKDFYEKLAQRGYIIAVQDVRGRFNSDGEFFPYFNEHDDGYDTVEWIAAQDWCDGNIGMTGGSYVGQTQWFAAVAPAAASQGDRADRLAARDALAQRARLRRRLPAGHGRMARRHGAALVAGRRVHDHLQRAAGLLRGAAAGRRCPSAPARRARGGTS